MLLNHKAVARLKHATAITYYPYRTHAQRNELSRMFLEEVGNLLDQKTESTIKHLVELYSNEEISYEDYLQRIEEISGEEEARGAARGGEYARNSVFGFAQKALDKKQERIHDLSLLEAKKTYQLERQKTEQSINDALQRTLAELRTKAQEYQQESNTQTNTFQETVDRSLGNLKTLLQTQEEDFFHQQEQTIEQTKMDIELIISTQLREERDRREKEIQEQEDRRPARNAAHMAIEQVKQLETRVRNYKYLKNGLIGLAILIFLLLIVLLFLLTLPQWAIAILLVVFASISITALVWKTPVSEDTLAYNKKQIVLFQTKTGEYAPLSEEERCTLLTQKIL